MKKWRERISKNVKQFTFIVKDNPVSREENPVYREDSFRVKKLVVFTIVMESLLHIESNTSEQITGHAPFRISNTC